ncbi:MAG: AAA family ATPase [Flavobacteriales bacterium]|jgi:exodeoxyribonuclease-5|nr:AAA family ATPase [Flavobacteriales bacterium]MDB9931993.1 AAA family ATPase [Flavobacteriales bacterium]
MKIDQFKELISQKFSYPFTKDQEQLLASLHKFLESTTDKKLFVMNGYAGTGKTSLVSALTQILGKFNYKTVLLAPTGRAAKVISGYSKRRAFTIHKMIYIYKHVNGRSMFVLKKNTLTNTLFIVDEASMIGDNSYMDKKSLLDDLMEYVYEGKKCSVIFVGDTAQLPPVGEEMSRALDPKFLESTFYAEVFHYRLTEVVRQTKESGILFNATKIRNKITDKELLPLVSNQQFSDVVRVVGNDLQDELESSYSGKGVENCIVLCRSNKRANMFNQHIRARILYKEEEIDAGDLMMVVKNNYHWLSDKSKAGFIANGDIIELLRITRTEELYGFKFATAEVQLIDYPDEEPFEVKLMLDAIMVESTSLPREELKKLFYAIDEEYLEEFPGRKERMEKVLKDPYFNALQVKFSYAVTCHKSQGGQWDTVFIDQGYLTKEMVNVEYLRWLYTAFTRAQSKLYLANFNDMFFEEEVITS